MATNLGSLVVSLGLDAATYTQGLSKAERQAEQAMRAIQGTITKIAGAFGAVIGADLFVGLIRSSIDAADHLNDLSKSTGLAVETIGGIGFAASQAGSDLDGAAASFGKFNLNVAKAAAGDKEAAEAFQALGISVKDAAGNTRAADQIFAEVADKFAGYADSPEQAALANAVFGKSYQSMLPLLKDGGAELRENIEFYRQHSGITTEAAKAADQFNDTLGKLGLLGRGAGQSLSQALLPSLQAVADALLDFAKESTAAQAIVTGIRVAFETVAIVGANVVFVFQGVGREIGAIAAQLVALGSGDLAGFKAISEAVKADGVRARAELDAFERRVLQLDKPLTDALRRQEDRGFNPLAKQAAPRLSGGDTGKDKISEAERYLDSLRKQLERTQDLTAVEQVLADIQAKRIKDITAGTAGQAIDIAEQIDARKRLESQLKAEEAQLDALRDAQRATAAEGKRVYEQTRTPLEQYNEELERQKRLLNEGAISLETYVRATALAGNALNAASESVNSQNEEITKNLSESIAEGILDGSRKGLDLMEIFKEELKAQFAKTILQPIVRPVAEAGNQLIQLLLKGIGTYFSTTGSDTNYSNEGRNYPPPAATGTNYVSRSGMAIVHEGEAIIPKRYNPAAFDAAGGSRTSVVVENHSGGEVRQERSRGGDGSELIRIVIGAVAQDIASGGGQVARAMRSRGVNLSGALAQRT